MSDQLEIKRCEVCGFDELESVLDLGRHPMCDDLVPITQQSECDTFPIHILYCRHCNTAHQKFQVPKVRLFPKSYHYRSRFTADVLSGMEALVESVGAKVGSLQGLTVLDVGCNDGSLLDMFAAKGATTIGVEPTGASADAEGRGHKIINGFFSESTAKEITKSCSKIDIITFTNVFAHIENLPSLLKNLKVLMNEETILVIENHYLGAVLEKNQFDTFYHEHPRTYSLHSFIHIAGAIGREVIAVEFPQRYGGNVRVVIGKIGTSEPEAISFIKKTLENESSYFGQFGNMRAFIASWQKKKKAEIQGLVNEHGKLLAKAFPGRAAILVALLGLSSEEIECVYEKPGSLKVGHYLPGTRIPIRSDIELFGRLPETNIILNLAWHIPAEIETYIREHGFDGQLVHII